MVPMLVTRWDAETRRHIYYNMDGTTAKDLDDADVWEDERLAMSSAEQHGAVIVRAAAQRDDRPRSANVFGARLRSSDRLR